MYNPESCSTHSNTWNHWQAMFPKTMAKWKIIDDLMDNNSLKLPQLFFKIPKEKKKSSFAIAARWCLYVVPREEGRKKNEWSRWKFSFLSFASSSRYWCFINKRCLWAREKKKSTVCNGQTWFRVITRTAPYWSVSGRVCRHCNWPFTFYFHGQSHYRLVFNFNHTHMCETLKRKLFSSKTAKLDRKLFLNKFSNQHLISAPV